MIQTVSGLALLGIFIIPVMILFLSFYQNLIESIKFDTKKQATRRNVYKNKVSNNISKTEKIKLKVVK